MTPCACGSGKPVVAHGRCATCYQRQRRAGLLPERKREKPARCACGRSPVYAKGQCRKCYDRAQKRLYRGRVRVT